MIILFHNSNIDNKKIPVARNLKNKKEYIFLYNYLIFTLSNTNRLNYYLWE